MIERRALGYESGKRELNRIYSG